jgi:hypothetical protein
VSSVRIGEETPEESMNPANVSHTPLESKKLLRPCSFKTVRQYQIVKLVRNFLIASAGYSLREALRVAEHNGVDPKAVVNMLTSTLPRAG